MQGKDQPGSLYQIADDLHLIDLRPPIPGFEEFLGCYVLRGNSVALIDVGPSNCTPTLLRGLATLKIAPEEISHIIVTPVHIAHAGGLGTIINHMPQARVVVHEKGKRHVVDDGSQ